VSRCLGRDNGTEFSLGDTVSFDHDGDRLTGKVVRVYNSRLVYHVEVNGERYEVEVPDDNPQRAGGSL
jgi:hypothetical protein